MGHWPLRPQYQAGLRLQPGGLLGWPTREVPASLHLGLRRRRVGRDGGNWASLVVQCERIHLSMQRTLKFNPRRSRKIL